MKALFAVQGIYYLLTGLWPIVDIASFQAVTGVKTDLWLVRTVGWLVAVSGLAFLLESRAWRQSQNLGLLALGQALALAGIDVYYTAKGTLSPVYLLDAVLEALFAGLWVRALLAERSLRRL